MNTCTPFKNILYKKYNWDHPVFTFNSHLLCQFKVHRAPKTKPKYYQLPLENDLDAEWTAGEIKLKLKHTKYGQR